MRVPVLDVERKPVEDERGGHWMSFRICVHVDYRTALTDLQYMNARSRRISGALRM